MSGVERCDEVLRLIDEVLEAAEPQPPREQVVARDPGDRRRPLVRTP